MSTSIEVRCPKGLHRLFSKLILDDDRPHIVSGNLIEFACTDCKRIYVRDGLPVGRVRHRFNLLGEHVETITDPQES